MPLPPTIRVKLSSEAAGAITITPVVVQEIPTRDLIDHMLGVTGKDELRVREILLRGTLVSGASRFRWQGWEPDPNGLRAVLATFPDPDPSLPFAADRCVRAILRGGRQPVELSPSTVSRKGLLERGGYWDLLMEVTGASGMAYAGYSYRDHADRYLRNLSAPEAERLRAESAHVPYSTLREQIRSVAFSQVELYAARQKVEAGAR